LVNKEINFQTEEDILKYLNLLKLRQNKILIKKINKNNDNVQKY